MNKNTKPVRLYPEDEQRLNRICALRYANNLDKKQLKPHRMIKAMLNIPNIEEVLLKAKIKNEQ